MRVAVSWTGGKESALALLRARDSGDEVVALVSIVHPVSGRLRAHEVRESVLQAQAAAMGVPIVMRDADWQGYEHHLGEALRDLRDERGVEGVVFGDVSTSSDRERGERVAAEAELKARFPLWGEDPSALLDEVRDRGLRCVVVSAERDLGPTWLGRFVDATFGDDMAAAHPHRGPLGEDGAYHTLVVGGPIFREPLDYVLDRRFESDAMLCVDVKVGAEAT